MLDKLMLDNLRAATSGRVITPGDEGYDQARTVFYGGYDRRPAVIVKAADEADVAYVVSLAKDHGIELAVRSGGHSTAGHSVNEGGIVLDLGEMKALDIDADERVAWVQPGLTAGEYTSEAAKFGLATGFGDTGSVGIGGITLGGGVGFLVRKHGLTIDDLLAADVVTADGLLRRVDAETNPDLFWAIRGGGGNFGVVTRLKLRLHKIGGAETVGTVYGGMLVLPATPEVIAGFVAAAEAAPDELSTIANVMTAPPMPFLPAELHGRLVVLAMLVYAGDAADGERAVAPFRALATPLADMLNPMPYPDVYPPDEEEYHPLAVGRTLFVESVDADLATTVLERLSTATAMMAVTQLRVLGGAVSRVPNDATAYAHRDRRIMVNVAALYQQPEEKAAHEAWANSFVAVLQQGTGGAYVNFLGDDGPERIREAYPAATWDRLVDVKRKYDPTNVFRANHNVSP
jgi:FAD/FMN-containing dehydrogenase